MQRKQRPRRLVRNNFSAFEEEEHWMVGLADDKPNRIEHDYEPKTSTLVFFLSKSAPKGPPEIVIGHGGRQYPYQLTCSRDLCGMYFASIKAGRDFGRATS
jgi:hypothetical protein